MFTNTVLYYSQHRESYYHPTVSNEKGNVPYIELKHHGGKCVIYPGQTRCFEIYSSFKFPNRKLGYLLNDPVLYNQDVIVKNPILHLDSKVYLKNKGKYAVELANEQVIARMVVISTDLVQLKNGKEYSVLKKCINFLNLYYVKTIVSAYIGGSLAFYVASFIKDKFM